MRVVFLTTLDPHDKRSGSAILHHMLHALQRYCDEVICIGPMNVKEQLIGKMLKKSIQCVLHKTFPYYLSCLLAKKYGRVAGQRLAEQSCDVIVAPFGTVATAFLETDIPIVLVEDATFALLHNYYAQFSHLLSRSICEAHMITQQAFNKASALIFSSRWAARSAIEHYQVEEARVHIIRFGANFEQSPPREVVFTRQRSERCKLLFVGVTGKEKVGTSPLKPLFIWKSWVCRQNSPCVAACLQSQYSTRG